MSLKWAQKLWVSSIGGVDDRKNSSEYSHRVG